MKNPDIAPFVRRALKLSLFFTVPTVFALKTLLLGYKMPQPDFELVNDNVTYFATDVQYLGIVS
jgi:hypothetical protein